MLRKLSFLGNRRTKVSAPARTKIDALAQRVNAAAGKLSALSNQQLKAAGASKREQLAGGDALTPQSALEALPPIVEAVRRTFGFALHPVQIYAAMMTASGQIIEMHTGEGKTVVTGAAALIRSLHGQGTHVATTNAYLAARDFEELQPTFDLLGIEAQRLPEEMKSPTESRAAYNADITYGPGYQFGFDFLFDQITLRQHNPSWLGRSVLHELNGFDINQQLVQCRALDACIVDEADSVLVDEATTPLILSFDTGEEISDRPYRLAMEVARTMEQDTHFKLDGVKRAVEITEAGKAFLRQQRQRSALKRLTLQRPWESYVKSALQGDHFLIRNEHYVLQNGEVNIVDQFTGRIFDDRSWQAGLHQAIEMKEGVTVTTPRVSKARVTRQRFMGFYHSLCGLSGTALGASRDFKEFYSVNVAPVPTHRPCLRQVLTSRFFIDRESRTAAIVAATRRRHSTGQPVLIGTNTIGDSMALAEGFAAAGVSALVLNGMQDREEAEIVAEAGKTGAITIATNMAGRGTDIKPDDQAKALGGLHVIGAAPNQSARIDRQLVGRAARQGQPGSAQFFICADDELLTNYAPQVARKIISACQRGRGEQAKAGESHLDFAKDIAAVQLLRDNAQFRSRKEMVMHDRWMDSIRDSVFSESAQR